MRYSSKAFVLTHLESTRTIFRAQFCTNLSFPAFFVTIRLSLLSKKYTYSCNKTAPFFKKNVRFTRVESKRTFFSAFSK